MKKLAILALFALSGCSTVSGLTVAPATATTTPTITATVSSTASANVVGAMSTGATMVKAGQLVCQIGPALLAAVDPSGAAVLAEGQSAAFVSAACGAVNGIAVSPPSNGQAGSVTVAVPTGL